MAGSSYKTIIKDSLRSLLGFSRREKKRILFLLPLLMAITLLFAWCGKPRFEQSFTMYRAGRIAERDSTRAAGGRNAPSGNGSGSGTGHSGNGYNVPATASGGLSTDSGTTRTRDSLFRFDPNTIGIDGLTALGFSQRQAQGIINYRNAGAVFRRPEDFAKCYTVSEEKFRQLLPYIDIRPQASSPGNSRGGAGRSGDADRETPSDAAPSSSIEPSSPARPALLELNGADSATLVAIRGIGALTAGRIVEYRRMLGGYASVEQLREVRGMYEENYQAIIRQIFVDGSGIKKIDINFALPESMKGHPYMPPETLNKILKYRQLKGGWSTIGELVEQDILSPQEAQKLAPYLYFRSE